MTATSDQWQQHFAESIRDWLVANGVDWDSVICWPQLDVYDDHFEVEQIHKDEHGRTELMHGSGGGILTTMVRYEHRVKINAELLRAYEHSRPDALDRQRTERIEQFLRNCPSVIKIEPGRRLVWVTRDHCDPEQSESVYKALRSRLPDFQHTLVTGVDTVMQAEPGGA